MDLLSAFLCCGSICLAGQILYDHSKLTAGHITSLIVIIGAALDLFHIYDRLLKYCHAGAALPITSFGHSLVHGALAAAQDKGLLGILLGPFDMTAGGITAGIFFAFVTAVVFKPKS